MSDEKAKCVICGEPMPEGEQMFKYHGHSGNCPKPPLPYLKRQYPTVVITAEQQVADARDAARYRWLAEAKNLLLTTCRHEVWTRPDGSTFTPSHSLAAYATQFGTFPTLNETIDAAMQEKAYD